MIEARSRVRARRRAHAEASHFIAHPGPMKALFPEVPFRRAG
jgi:hypothetical protein